MRIKIRNNCHIYKIFIRAPRRMKLKIVYSCLDLDVVSFVLVTLASAPCCPCYSIYLKGGPSFIPIGHKFFAKEGF